MSTPASPPYAQLVASTRPQSALRARITADYRIAEPDALARLLPEARLDAAQCAATHTLALALTGQVRAKLTRGGQGIEALIHEYSLSSQEGVALMCLAEALLRIPDADTRDALIRDKIADGDWQAHLGRSRSLFVNAATWGLLITGKLTSTSSETGLSASMTRLIARGGEPLIRKGVDITMRLLGEQFVCGQTIAEALAHSRGPQSRGFRYSYDMLGEAALTAADAARYGEQYEQAIHAIGEAAAGAGIYDGPGISIKLSALHPRYSRSQLARVHGELLPRLRALALLARRYDIGLNIDAEETDRLDLSLDLLEALCFDEGLRGWNGIGFVIQGYQKRCRALVDWLVDLARRSHRRLMIRLVKGAYWDGEIKRAQLDGQEDFPVFTRKAHTDVSYLACARALLAAPREIFPQFATHNAQTLASIVTLAGPNYYAGQYEFQCLHGMGEPLYEEVVGRERLGRPCRIYAPVGSHETLLAYLVRRLLENGANTSFVNRIADPNVALEELVIDPVTAATALSPPGSAHPKIALPRALYAPERANSAGFDFSDERALADLAQGLAAAGARVAQAAPIIADDAPGTGATRALCNPATGAAVGSVRDATAADVARAFEAAEQEREWCTRAPAARAPALQRAADLLEQERTDLIDLIVREAGRTIPNAVGELREAADFLRYYAVRTAAGTPLGTAVCISPWNFPLAIFTGQVAAALAAGNRVLAKPAEQTPLVAAAAVRLLHAAGVPHAALQLLPGDGSVGAALIADPRCDAVLFTGSTEVARLIEGRLAGRVGRTGQPVALIAETGGLNAMIVDSSALPEQVVNDVVASAFDSAGQRCSALRVLCLQTEVADTVLTMLRGAMQEQCLAAPDRLDCDIGPLIEPAARERIVAHLGAMRARGCPVFQPTTTIPSEGWFVAPALVEIARFDELPGEVFGPVLHVLRYRRSELDALIGQINAAGFGLTFGLHTRIDELIAHVTPRIRAGNLYVNRNMIGAVVGVQPFGGRGLSGTGPKAGGPLYVARLARALPPTPSTDAPLRAPPPALGAALAYQQSLGPHAPAEAGARVRAYLDSPVLQQYECPAELPGPVGERNEYWLRARGRVACLATTPLGGWVQVGAALCAGNQVLIAPSHPVAARLEALGPAARAAIAVGADPLGDASIDTVLLESDAGTLAAVAKTLAARPGPIVPLISVDSARFSAGAEDFDLRRLFEEVTRSTNTAAAGGNASLMTLG